MFDYDTFNGSGRGDYLAVEPIGKGTHQVGVYHMHSNLTGGFIRFYQTELRATQADAAELVERKFPAMPKINRECLDIVCPDGKEAGNVR